MVFGALYAMMQPHVSSIRRHRNCTGRLRTVIVLQLLLLAPVAARAQSRGPAPVGPDAFGYRLLDSGSGGCNFNFVDIAGSGTSVGLVASGAAAADDDGGATISLVEPFEWYGEGGSSVVVSSNGYLALAPSLTREDGGDFSNDPVLPAIPGNDVGSPQRILAYHDELDGAGSGDLAYQYFATCPRPSEALGSESCTVVQWSDWTVRGQPGRFDLQALLYHGSLQIVVQIRPQSATLNAGTIGIQDRGARIAASYRPSGALVADTAVCWFEPRFPAGGPTADIEVSNSDPSTIVAAGQLVRYAVGVRNRGPSPVTTLTVSNPLPAGLVNCSWSCNASAGSHCSPAGVGGIADDVDLLPEGWADYELTCTNQAVGSTISNTVDGLLPAGTTDPNPADNSATDLNQLGAGDVADTLRLERLGGDLRLLWESSCLTGDDDYGVYVGSLGDFDSHLPESCSTAGALERLLPPPIGDVYFLVVPANTFAEGSYGRASDGRQRPASTAACRPTAAASCSAPLPDLP